MIQRIRLADCGKGIGQCVPRHRHQEFLKSLRRLDQEFPEPLALHLVLDNYGTHNSREVQRWLARHPRFVCHFVPTTSIDAVLAAWDKRPRPFVWTANVEDIIKKLERACSELESIEQGCTASRRSQKQADTC